MKSLQKQKLITKRTLAVAVAAFLSLTIIRDAAASQSHESGAIIPCGSLQTFTGDVQVFDASRTQVVDVTNDKRLQCGDWVAVNQGQATIRHHAGYVVTVGAGSFIQIQDPQSGDNPEKDHFALYRGQAIFKSDQPERELKVATANARAKFKASEGYLLYSVDLQITQLVGIAGTSTLENRFLDVRPSSVSTSQYASMGELEGRPIPSQARAVSMLSVRERLARLGVKDDIQKQMVEAMRSLAQTRMPTKLEPKEATRRIASELPTATKSIAAYELTAKQENTNFGIRYRRPAAESVRKKAIWTTPPRETKSRAELEKERILKELSEIEPD